MNNQTPDTNMPKGSQAGTTSSPVSGSDNSELNKGSQGFNNSSSSVTGQTAGQRGQVEDETYGKNFSKDSDLSRSDRDVKEQWPDSGSSMQRDQKDQKQDSKH